MWAAVRGVPGRGAGKMAAVCRQVPRVLDLDRGQDGPGGRDSKC